MFQLFTASIVNLYIPFPDMYSRENGGWGTIIIFSNLVIYLGLQLLNYIFFDGQKFPAVYLLFNLLVS